MRRLSFALLLGLAIAAQAQVLYKWTDAEGRIHYGDRVPKGFTGKVERLEPPEPADAPTPRPEPPAAVPAKPAPAPEVRKTDAPVDIGKRRRETRERLRAAIVAAEERLEQAKAQLGSGEPTRDDERQVIQQMAGKPNSLPAAKRSNCRTVTTPEGKQAVMCPAVIPNEQYYDRIRGLEEAVKQAEHELDRAKEAYRRGVD